MPDVGQLRGHKSGALTGQGYRHSHRLIARPSPVPAQARPGQNAIHAKAEPQKLFIECFQFEWFRFRTKTNTNTNTETESASAIECVSGQGVGGGRGRTMRTQAAYKKKHTQLTRACGGTYAV